MMSDPLHCFDHICSDCQEVWNDMVADVEHTEHLAAKIREHLDECAQLRQGYTAVRDDRLKEVRRLGMEIEQLENELAAERAR
jgi:hypothetical protein